MSGQTFGWICVSLMGALIIFVIIMSIRNGRSERRYAAIKEKQDQEASAYRENFTRMNAEDRDWIKQQWLITKPDDFDPVERMWKEFLRAGPE